MQRKDIRLFDGGAILLVVAIVVGVFLAAGGGRKLLKAIDSAEALCAAEARAHSFYMTWIAPRRPAEKVAKENAFYAKVEKACAEGGTLDRLRALIESAQAARD